MARDTISPNFPGLDSEFAAGERVTTRSTRFSNGLAAGSVIAALVDPFGSGSSYASVGTVPPQIALSGSNIVRGSGAVVVGGEYGLWIVVTSPDGVPQPAVKLTFRAVLPFGGTASAVLSMTGPALTAANVGDTAPYTPTITGGTAPYVLSLASGALPAGRSIAGLAVTGTYTTAATYSYTLLVTDALGATATLAVGPVAVAAASASVIDLLIVSGQSNGEAFGTSATFVAPTQPANYTNTGYLKTYSGSAFANYVPYTNSDGNNSSSAWGAEAQYAYRRNQAFPTAGPLYLAKYAVGGTSLATQWLPGTTNYNTLVSRVVAAKGALPAAAASITFLWIQGEADSGDSTQAGNYQANLGTLWSQIKTDTGATKMLLVRLGTNPNDSGRLYWNTVKAGQEAFAAANTDVELISADLLTKQSDNLHYIPSSVDALGDNCYNAASKSWSSSPFALISDIANDNFVMWETAGNLATRKSRSFSEIYTTTTTATTSRTYVAQDGTLRNDLVANQPRFTWINGKKELLVEPSQQNACLYNRDMTGAAWTATGATVTTAIAGPLKTGNGSDVANSASTITATAANATVLQAISATSASRLFSIWLKRITGTGVIQITQDGGATYTTVTLTTNWQRFTIAAQTLVNPTVGIRIVTSGDAVGASLAQSEINLVTQAIPTIASAVTRNTETIAFTTKANSAFQGAAATYVVKGTGPTQTGPVFLNGDTNSVSLLRRNGNALQAENGITTPQVNSFGGGFVGAYAVAGGYDATGNKLSFNGSPVTTDANQPGAHTTVAPFGNAIRGNSSYIGGPINYLAAGPSLVSDAALTALTS